MKVESIKNLIVFGFLIGFIFKFSNIFGNLWIFKMLLRMTFNIEIKGSF